MFTAPSARTRKGMKRSLFGLAFALAAACQVAPAFAQTPPPAPQPGTDVWVEDFNTGSPPITTTAIDLRAYTGLYGSTYTSDPKWGTGAGECNGWLLNSDTDWPPTDTACNQDGGVDYNGVTHTAWAYLKAMADILGDVQGLAPGENNVLASMTNNGGAPNTFTTAIQIGTDNLVPDPALVNNHYYIASAYFAAIHCHLEDATWTDPSEMLEFFVDGTSVASDPGIDPCTAGTRYTYDFSGADHLHVYVAQVDSSVWQATGITAASTFGLHVSDPIRATTGNDVAIDMLKVTDVTPQLSESFDDDEVPVGDTTTLTFTITNTTDNLAKPGWSFDETLPPGLTLVSTPTTTCPGGNVTSTGPNSFKVEGNLDAGAANNSCTVSVKVTSATPDTYTNDPNAPAILDNVTALPGLLNPPALAKVRFAGADMVAAEVSPPTPSSPGSSDMTVVTSCTNDGPLVADNPTCDVTVTGGTSPTTTCTPSPLPASLAVGSSITCTTTYTQGNGPVTIETIAGSDTYDPNAGNNKNTITQPAPFSSAPTSAVPTGEALPWLLLLLLTATGWYAMARRNRR